MLNENMVVTEGSMPYEVRAEVCQIGEDVVVLVSGGEKPHVGAVAVGIPRPSLEDPDVVSSTASVFALVGHKEDDVAKIIARKMSALLNKNTVVTVGIHVDNINAEGIKLIQENCDKVVKRILQHYRA